MEQSCKYFIITHPSDNILLTTYYQQETQLKMDGSDNRSVKQHPNSVSLFSCTAPAVSPCCTSSQTIKDTVCNLLNIRMTMVILFYFIFLLYGKTGIRQTKNCVFVEVPAVPVDCVRTEKGRLALF